MDTFLKETLLDILKTTDNISEVIFIVPSKRAGLFLKKTLIELTPNQVYFTPIILSIEEFISELSGLQQLDHIQTLFEFYEVYLSTHNESNKDSFENFSNWAQTLIYDFNEIDRYCIDPDSFFNYLSGVQDLNHWYLQKEKTELVQNYISFWNNLITYYTNFKNHLVSKKIGYQGLLYREAADAIKKYVLIEKRKHFLLGFNALNNAEQYIFQTLLEQGIADVYWDGDEFFFNNNYHEASLFLRNYKNQWPYFKNHPFRSINTYFSEEKEIKIIGTSKNVGQAKTVSGILSQIPTEQMDNTALILADESLLDPVLNHLPRNIKALNITMGLPLKEIPLASFFELIFDFQKSSKNNYHYFKDVITLLNNPYCYKILGQTSKNLEYIITSENIVSVSIEKLVNSTPISEEKEIIQLLFGLWKDASIALQNCIKIIQLLKTKFDKQEDALELEYAYHFYTIFNKLIHLQETYTHPKTITSLYNIYKDLLQSDSLDFRGEPFMGLQLMGMLESRCLDFDTVIITSVNEGVLPAGKSINSFIPYDLKRAYNLPTYREKDAIYTYHFYRVIQRAKKVYVVYNTENDGVGGGEKSRFVQQLVIDKRPEHKVTQYIVSPDIPIVNNPLIEIDKNEEVIAKIKALAQHGFSPSALTAYIRNPLDFYYRYILGIKEPTEVEETIAANTLGTIIHNTLENFYKPLEGKLLTTKHLKSMTSQIDAEIRRQFKKEYAQLDIKQGKNLLIFEVAKKYIKQFISSEMQSLKEGNEIKIVAIESNLKAQVHIEEFDFQIFIKGKVDRIDTFNGNLRVIDYKTGKVVKGDVILMDWEPITEDYKYSKAMQILAYAYMYTKTHNINSEISAGIISFKNLKGGYLGFGTKASVRGKVDYQVSPEVITQYSSMLKRLIQEILNPQIPFTEKQV